MADEQEVKPGYYECKLNGYGGHIQFPYPLTWQQLKLWWDKGVEPLKELARLDFGHMNVQWQGARELILEYGQWALTGNRISPGDAKDDNIPAEVVTFVIAAAEDYIHPCLPPRQRHMLRTRQL